MVDYESINKITRQIAEKDPELAGLFEPIINNLFDQILRNIYADKNHPERVCLLKIRIEDLVNPNNSFGYIRIIPGTPDNSSHPYCLCFAFDKWQSDKGFRGITKNTIDYWLVSTKINRGTLIFTYAWDNVDFMDKYVDTFDHYTKDSQHTVAIVLISSRDISLQYLNK